MGWLPLAGLNLASGSSMPRSLKCSARSAGLSGERSSGTGGLKGLAWCDPVDLISEPLQNFH